MKEINLRMRKVYNINQLNISSRLNENICKVLSVSDNLPWLVQQVGMTSKRRRIIEGYMGDESTIAVGERRYSAVDATSIKI